MKERIKITFLGDIMCSIPETVKARVGEDSFDYHPAFQHVREVFSQSDYVVGNLETPIAGHELNYTSETTLFNTPVDFVKALKNAGVDMVTAANNHALDRGLLGLQRTIHNLRNVSIDFTGIRDSKNDSAFLIKNFGGFKIAFLSYTYGTDSDCRNNALYADESFHLNYFREQDVFPVNVKTSKTKEFLKLIVPEFIKRIGRDSTYPDCGLIKDIESPCFEGMLSEIRKAKQQSDYVILCIHIGGQYNNDIASYTKIVIEKCVEAGCDTVVGNHPHCVQKSKMLPNGFLAYALGNFYCTPHWGYYLDGVWADYSILLNLYFDTLKHSLTNVTFSVAKSVEEYGHSVVIPVYELYGAASEKEKRQLEYDNAAVISRFLGRKRINRIPIEKEYIYSDDIL